MLDVLVCGGRDFLDKDLLDEVLTYLISTHPVTTIIDGAASGADTLANAWARSRGLRERRLPALWKTEGKAAGPRRNRRMLEVARPDLVIAFPGGVGTSDMIHQSREAGLTIIDVDLDDWKKAIDTFSYQM